MKKAYFIFLHLAVFAYIGLFKVDSMINQASEEKLAFEFNAKYASKQLWSFQFEGCTSCIDVLKENGLKGHVLSAILYDSYLSGHPEPVPNSILVEIYDMEPREGNENPIHPMKNVGYDPSYLLSMDVDSMSELDAYLWSEAIMNRVKDNEIDRSLIGDQKIEDLQNRIEVFDDLKKSGVAFQFFYSLKKHFANEPILSGTKIYI